MKDKLILKDLTEMELETGASLSNLGVLFPDKTAMVAAWDRLTQDNLAEVKIKNGDGLVVGSYTDMVLVSETSTILAGILTNSGTGTNGCPVPVWELQSPQS